MSDAVTAGAAATPALDAALARGRSAFRARGYALEVRDLGDWGDRVRPLAEIDAEARTVRLDARSLTARLARSGDAAAARSVDDAVRHELAHLDDPSASETTIRARVDAEAAEARLA